MINWAQVTVAVLCDRLRADNPGRPEEILGVVLRSFVVPHTVRAIDTLGRNLATAGALWACHEQGARAEDFAAHEDRGGNTRGIAAPWEPSDRVPHPRYTALFGT